MSNTRVTFTTDMVYSAIKQFVIMNGYMPSISEVSNIVGCSRKTAQRRMLDLGAEGKLKFADTSSLGRNYRIVSMRVTFSDGVQNAI